MHIGHKIKKIRDERNFSQAEMADFLGMSQSAYSRMERDETPVVMDELVRYAKTLNVPIQDFLPDFINVQNVNDHGQGGPNLIMGDFHYHQNGDTESQKLMIQILQKVLERLDEGGK
jgi:transcriptional regulator with XRE-family HTH domain